MDWKKFLLAVEDSMAARSVWKGYIQFSLVNIPTKAYTATVTHGGKIALNQLHKDCGSRIRYQKVCPVHGEISADEIVSGYEFSKDQYVVIEPEEIAKIRHKNERMIQIESFIPTSSIDARYYSGRSLYILPDGVIGKKPYAMLHQLMLEEERVAFANGIFSNREQMILLRPVDKLIMATFLSYASELKPPAEFEPEVPDVEVSKKELDLARTLVAQLSEKSIDLTKYTDNYTNNLEKLIEAKVAGQEIVAAPAEEEPHVINLMEALQKSLDSAKAKTKPKKMVAPSTAKRVAATKGRKRKTG